MWQFAFARGIKITDAEPSRPRRSLVGLGIRSRSLSVSEAVINPPQRRRERHDRTQRPNRQANGAAAPAAHAKDIAGAGNHRASPYGSLEPVGPGGGPAPCPEPAAHVNA